MSQRMSQPTRHPAIWLDATYTVQSAAAVTGFTVDVIYGAVKWRRLRALPPKPLPVGEVAGGVWIAGLDLWKFWVAERRRMRLDRRQEGAK